MEYNRYLWGFVLLVAGALPTFAQVSNDNEDEVNKIDSRAGQKSFVPGQVLVKFKDESPVNVSRARGMFRAASISAVDAVLKEFGVETMDKLLPNEKPKPVSSRRKAKAFNGQNVVESDLSQLYIVKMNSLRQDSTLQLVEKLQELDEVEFAEPNYKVYIMGQVPNPSMSATPAQQPTPRRAYSTEATGEKICVDPSKNPLYTQQWGIKKLKVNELWNKTIINKKRPVIAILDTGVDITHPDLADNIWTNQKEAEGEANYDNDGNGFKGDVHGWDFINNTAVIRDYNSHGTHVAGIAAAADNEIGIVGANPQALIMPVTVMQSDGTGDIATIAKGVNYAVANGATIINMSFGSYANSNVLRTALAKAYQSAVLVAAAGNDSKGIYTECSHNSWSAMNDMVMYPAGYEFVMGVQATTRTGDLSSFSNYDCDGPTFSLPAKDIWSTSEGYVNYEMSAPGVGIISSTPGGNYKEYNGTSMSAPLLSGGISALQMIKKYGSQEILWGDLIHSSSMLDAYNINERPAVLELQSIIWDDISDGGNGDGKPDAGEILRIYPIIKTTWGEAKNIKLNLSVAEFDDAELVDILTNDVDFGWNLSSYAHNTSKNPIKIKIGNNVTDSRHIRLLLTTTCADAAQDISYEFPIVVNNIVKIGGYLTDDLTLTPDKNYIVDKNIFIPEGVKFIVEPGTILKFNGCGIKNEGEMCIKGTPQKPIVLTTANGVESWPFITGNYNQLDVIEYCHIENTAGRNGSLGDVNCKNCIFYHPIGGSTSAGFIPYNMMYRCNIIEGELIDLQNCNYNAQNTNYGECNYVNNRIAHSFLPRYERMGNVNYFNNLRANVGGTILDQFSFDEWFSSGLVKPEKSSYLGTSKEDIANTFILDIDYDYGYAQADLSTILKKTDKWSSWHCLESCCRWYRSARRI